MPKVTTRFTWIKLKGDYTKQLDAQIQILNRNAARAWIRAVILRVPVWSGMTMGSIKFASGPGGSLAAFLNVSVPIDPVKGATRSSKNASVGGDFGSYDFVNEQQVYLFRFNSTVPQYMHHEFFSRPAGVNQQIIAPWLSFEAGKAAYNETFRAGISKLPKIQKFFLRTKIGGAAE